MFIIEGEQKNKSPYNFHSYKFSQKFTATSLISLTETTENFVCRLYRLYLKKLKENSKQLHGRWVLLPTIK